MLYFSSNLDLLCTKLTKDYEGYREYVYEYGPSEEPGKLGPATIKPYYDEPKKGDYWVINGEWYGRVEPGGFRVLATHILISTEANFIAIPNHMKDSSFEELREYCKKPRRYLYSPPKFSKLPDDWDSDIVF